MKSKKLLVAVGLMLTATAALAQQHIQQAFDALRQSDAQREVWSKHSMERDPDTGHMEGMSDIYDFMMTNPTAQNRQLITNIRRAFDQDEAAAYTVSTGGHGGSDNYASLAVGNSNAGGVAIGQMKGSTHIYACFLDPDDTTRTHRYAYALEWVDDGNKIRGRIAKTYATTLKFRQQASGQRRSTVTINGSTMQLSSQDGALSLSAGGKSAETWLSEFTTYKNLFLKTLEGTSSNTYATLIYKLCKESQPLDDAERTMVTAEMQKLKQKTKDEFIQQLFDISIERLKK